MSEDVAQETPLPQHSVEMSENEVYACLHSECRHLKTALKQKDGKNAPNSVYSSGRQSYLAGTIFSEFDI